MAKPIFYTNVNNSNEDILTAKDLLRDKLDKAEIKINELPEKEADGATLKVNIYTGLSYEEFDASPDLVSSMLYPEKHLLGDEKGLRDIERHCYRESPSDDTSVWWEREPDYSDVTIRYTATPFREASHYDSAVVLRDGLVIINNAEKHLCKPTTPVDDPRFFVVFPNTYSNVSDKICGILEFNISNSPTDTTNNIFVEGNLGDPIVIKTEELEALSVTDTLFTTIKDDLTFYPSGTNETTSSIKGDIKFVDKIISCEPFVTDAGTEVGFLYRAVIFYDPENKNLCRDDGRGIIVLKITDNRP